MTPSHAVKGGVRYRYYISRAPTDSAATIVRLPAPDVEEAVLKALADTADLKGTSATISAKSARANTEDLIAGRLTSVGTLVARVNVRRGDRDRTCGWDHQMGQDNCCTLVQAADPRAA